MSTGTSERKPCVFCGSTSMKITKQHIAPKQLRNVFEGVISDSGTTSIRTGTNPPIEFSSAPFDDKVGGFCEACNSTWMQAIEARAVSILTPMMTRGFPKLLTVADQAELSTWAVLFALVLDHQVPQNRVVPEAEYGDFYANRTPLINHLVWIGKTDPRSNNLVISTRKGRVRRVDAQIDPVFVSLLQEAMTNRQWIYVFTFSVGFAVFQVMGHNVD